MLRVRGWIERAGRRRTTRPEGQCSLVRRRIAEEVRERQAVDSGAALQRWDSAPQWSPCGCSWALDRQA